MNDTKLESDACAALALTRQNVKIDNLLGLTTETYHVVFVDGLGIDVQGRSFEHASLEAMALYPGKDIRSVELVSSLSQQYNCHR